MRPQWADIIDQSIRQDRAVRRVVHVPGDIVRHPVSGGCGRRWMGDDGLVHTCRAPRHATACVCPCGAVRR